MLASEASGIHQQVWHHNMLPVKGFSGADRAYPGKVGEEARTFSRAPTVAGRVICDASSTMQTSNTRRANIALLVLRHVHATCKIANYAAET